MKLLKIGFLIFACLVVFSIILATCSPVKAYDPLYTETSEDLRCATGIWNWDQNIVYELGDLATGGRNQNEFWAYDLNARTWSLKATWPGGGYPSTRGSCYYNGYVYVAIGYSPAKLWRYNVILNSWAVYPNIPVIMDDYIVWYDWGPRQTYDDEGNRITVYDDRICIAEKNHSGNIESFYYRDKDSLTGDWILSGNSNIFWECFTSPDKQPMLSADGQSWIWSNHMPNPEIPDGPTGEGPGLVWDTQSNTGYNLTDGNRLNRYSWGPIFNYTGRYFQWQNTSNSNTFSNCDLYVYDDLGGQWYLFKDDLPTGSNLSPVLVGPGSWGWYDAAHTSWLWGAPVSTGDKKIWEIDMSGAFDVLEVDERIVEIPVNDIVVPGSPGGVITAIDWESPRFAYADEELVFSVFGDVNEPVDWYLVNEDGDVLDSGSNVIRADGVYYVVAEVPLATEGFVYVYELGSGVRSLWGYVASASGEIDPLTTWAAMPGDSSLNMIDSTSIGRYSWFLDALYNTFNIPVSFDVVEDWGAGDTVYTVDVDDYNELCFPTYSGTANLALTYNRYLLCRFDAEATDEDYDGLVTDFDILWDAQTRGLYTLEVGNEEGYFVADSQSAYAYGGEESGIAASLVLDRARYAPLGTIKGSVIINSASGLLDAFDQIQIKVIGIEVDGMTAGTEVSQTDAMNLSSLTTNFELVAPSQVGSYKVVALLSNQSGPQTMELEKAFGVSTGGESGGSGSGNPFSGIGGLLEGWGVSNTLGHWLILIIGMVLCCVFAMMVGSQHKGLLAVILCLAVVAIGLMAGWIQWWLVILLAVGGGIVFTRILTPKGGA